MPQSAKTVCFDRRELSGSRLRCLIATSGAKSVVAKTLSELASPAAKVTPEDVIMPRGFISPYEAQLGDDNQLLDEPLRDVLLDWWLEVRHGANTPNWDIAATCDIGGKRGLLLVEAKAHASELETAGKRDNGNAKNHRRIGQAIDEAKGELNANGDVGVWSISRDSHYQLSNRFAWSWKLASLGVPVVLIYLGFLDAEEMRHRGEPFHSFGHWRVELLKHAKGIVPEAAWEQRLDIGEGLVFPQIRAVRLRCDVLGEGVE